METTNNNLLTPVKVNGIIYCLYSEAMRVMKQKDQDYSDLQNRNIELKSRLDTYKELMGRVAGELELCKPYLPSFRLEGRVNQLITDYKNIEG